MVGVTLRESDFGIQSRYCTVRRCPDPIAQPDGFVDLLIGEAKRFDSPPVLIPTEDAFVVALAERRRELEPHFRFNLPAEDGIRNVIDKRLQYRIASGLSVPTPCTFSPETMEEVAAAGETLRYPAFVKPVFTYQWLRHFSGKGFEVQNAGELRDCYEKIFRAGVPCVVQEVIPGPPQNLYSVCLYAMSGTGRIVAEFGMHKLRQSPPDYGVGTLVESAHDPQLLELARKFCSGCGYTGVAEIEFKRDERDGVFKFIELNPRLWTQNGLAAACGVDFPYLEYADLTGAATPPQIAYPDGIKWVDWFEDLYRCWHYRRQYRMGFLAWLRSLEGVGAFATFAADDLRPFFGTARRYAMQKARALARR